MDLNFIYEINCSQTVDGGFHFFSHMEIGVQYDLYKFSSDSENVLFEIDILFLCTRLGIKPYGKSMNSLYIT